MRSVTICHLLGCLSICACAGSPRSDSSDYVDAAKGYSLSVPPTWTASADPGKVVLKPIQATGAAVITIRSVPLPDTLVDGRKVTLDTVAQATETVLLALPRSSLAHATPIPDLAYPSRQFDVTYTPREHLGAYHRREIVLLGSKHIFHIIYSAPSRTALDAALFADVVKSFREEG